MDILIDVLWTSYGHISVNILGYKHVGIHQLDFIPLEGIKSNLIKACDLTKHITFFGYTVETSGFKTRLFLHCRNMFYTSPGNKNLEQYLLGPVST